MLDAAKVKGFRSGENPARWRGHLSALLPARNRLSRGHHAALPYEDLPDFMASLRASEDSAARALEFLILTAARSGEVRGMRWSEIDADLCIWTIPAPRMKAGRQHRVPLSSAARRILEELPRGKPDDLVFPGRARAHPLSDMALSMLLRRLKIPATVHGFRSTFRDWAGELTQFPREIAEAALAHVVGDETERAYRRGDALDKRRSLMEAWATYCAGRAANVIAVNFSR